MEFCRTVVQQSCSPSPFAPLCGDQKDTWIHLLPSAFTASTFTRTSHLRCRGYEPLSVNTESSSMTVSASAQCDWLNMN